MIIPKSICPKGYQVIATYDGPPGAFCYQTGTYFKRPWRPSENLSVDEHGLALPNVPMRAKSTLLAELLRTGKYVTGKRQKDTRTERKPNYVARAKELKRGQLIGVEIEYYPKNNIEPKTNALTNVCGDGSLDSGGIEIRRLTWASSTGRLDGLLSLKLNGTVNKRCGLHIHIDVRHLQEPLLNGALLSPVKTYERLISLYPMLKKLVPKSRHNNQFCRWRNNCTSSESCDFTDRYCAINFKSYEEHGTIEFRLQSGSTNIVKIESWALLCQFLTHWCANPINSIPTTWTSFLAIIPEPLRSWCILRNQKLYGTAPQYNERSMSAIDNERSMSAIAD
jgi:hypothetical protein